MWTLFRKSKYRTSDIRSINLLPILIEYSSNNDIDESVGGKILKFADDTKIYHKIRFDDDIAYVQPDLCNLVLWSKEWQMLFDVAKCKVMHFCYNNWKTNYFMDGVNLEHVTEEKDLGVIISTDLKWENSVVVQCVRPTEY